MTGRFAPRPTSPTGEIAINGWRLKTYEITLDGAPIDRSVIAAATPTWLILFLRPVLTVASVS